MNKKIKVIELLNKIANNEQMPSKIRFEGLNYQYKGSSYYDRNGDLLCENCDLLCVLDSEVEILEDEEDIDINDLEDLPLDYKEVSELCSNETFVDFHNNTRAEINKIIKYLRKLDKKINKEE